MEYIKAGLQGFEIGVYWWHSVVFNYKVPMGICWLIAIVQVPINILVMIIWTMFNRNAVSDAYDEMINNIIEKEEEA